MFHSNVWKGGVTTLCIAGFAVIAYFVTQGVIFPFDREIQTLIFSMQSECLTGFLVPLTYSGNWQTIAAICLFLLLCSPTRKPYGIPLTLTAFLSLCFYETLKFVFQRPRPDLTLRMIPQDGYSFPSGHSLTSLVFWGTFLFLLHAYASIPAMGGSYDFPRIKNKKTVRLVTVFICFYIFFMGFSRIYLGVHFPTDVLGSWFLGGAILTILSTYHLDQIFFEK